jgi:phage terminase small subunit
MNSQKKNDNAVINDTKETTAVDKKTARKSKKNTAVEDTLFVVLDDETCVDINNELTWNCSTLTDRQKMFIFFYAYPYRNNARGKGAESARRAGYSKATANVKASELLRDKVIYKELNSIREQINNKITKVNLKSKIGEIIDAKLRRLNVKPSDFYNIKNVKPSEGAPFVNAEVKTKNELTEEQLDLIEDVEFVGQRGIVHYKLPNKREAENEIIKVYKDLFGDTEKDNSDGMEIETTAEIIKGNLQVKMKVIKNNAEITELSDLKQQTDKNNRAEED